MNENNFFRLLEKTRVKISAKKGIDYFSVFNLSQFPFRSEVSVRRLKTLLSLEDNNLTFVIPYSRVYSNLPTR